MYDTLTPHALDDGHAVHLGHLPGAIAPDADTVAHLWDLHPEDYQVIHIHGRKVRTPRWQQAYGADYRYSGQVNRALPLEPEMEPLLAWAREAVDPRLNGLLFNWYEAAHGHYIGKHRDSTAGMVEGTPIVTISLGEERVFRLRPYKGRGYTDVPVPHSSVLVIPWATNLAYTHEVPHFARYQGRRISVTLRAFTSTSAE